MGLGLFQLIDIKNKVRKLTARPSTNQLSDSDLVDYINRYYQLQLPLEIRPLELRGWFQFDLVAGQDEYDLTSSIDFPLGLFEDNYLTIETPTTINGYDLEMYLDPDMFFMKWPEVTTYASSRPEDVLFYDEKLLFRYIPDDTYTAKFAAWKRPAALVNDNDYPVQESWGDLISYGAAREILTDYAEIERLSEIIQLKQMEQNKLMRKVHYQNVNQRAIPKF